MLLHRSHSLAVVKGPYALPSASCGPRASARLEVTRAWHVSPQPRPHADLTAPPLPVRPHASALLQSLPACLGTHARLRAVEVVVSAAAAAAGARETVSRFGHSSQLPPEPLASRAGRSCPSGEGMTSDRRAPLLPVPPAFVHCMVDIVVPIVRRLRLGRTDGLRLPETFGRAGGGVRVSPVGLRVWSSERWTRPVSALLDLGRPASGGKETPGSAQRVPRLLPGC